MKSNAARLLAVAVMIGAVTVSVSLLSGAEEKTEEKQTAVSWQEGETTAAAEQREDGYYVVLRGGVPGQTLGIYDTTGKEVQQVQADEDGEFTAGPMCPGCYATWQPETGCGRFILAENASVEVSSGNLSGDGELLYLTDGESCSVKVQCSVSRARVAEDGFMLVIALEGQEGTSYSHSFYLEPEEPPETLQKYVRTCLFDDLPPGTYQVKENGTYCQTITLPAGAICTVDLT